LCQVGDPVAMEPGVPCRFCEHCKTGTNFLPHEAPLSGDALP
jgi:threonine dehydrogenase-like Zn-dependent dehydrogenase